MAGGRRGSRIGGSRWHIGMVILFILLTAMLAPVVPQAAMYALLGVPITLFALWQLAGAACHPHPSPPPGRDRLGYHRRALRRHFGDLGPPLIVYLLSIGTPKAPNRSACRAWCSLLGRSR